MQIVIVYESMHGNTHEVARRMAAGIAGAAQVELVPVARATDAVVGTADLLIVGGPTHVRDTGWATSPPSAGGDDLALDRDVEGPGLRNWFHRLAGGRGAAATAFDTRPESSTVVSGRASRGISRRLRQLGFHELTSPESFLVSADHRLLAGEGDRAEAWAADLVRLLDPIGGHSGHAT